MKKVFALFGILLLFFAGYIWFVYFRKGPSRPKDPKPVSLTVSKHSDAFNQSMQSMLYTYYDLSEAFVNWDTVAIAKSANELKIALDSLRLDELKKVDTAAIYESALD